MCGIVGVFNLPEASNLAYLCLYALQHRGQESAGIASSDGEKIFQHKAMGHVSDIFTKNVLSKLPGKLAIGHVRYSTSGESSLKNAYPFVIKHTNGSLAVVHNGNLTNYKVMREQLEEAGAIFQANVDSEAAVHLVAKGGKKPLDEKIANALSKMKGSYSYVFMNEKKMVVARDPRGWRPLALGKLGDGYVVASESCAFDLIGAKYIREVEPGEMIVFDSKGMHSSKPFKFTGKKAYCIFEHIYFSRPDSQIFGRNVYETRVGFGRQLAKEHPVKADMVIPVPDSGVPAAIGYSEESKIPFQMGLIRNHYVGRTFIEPTQAIRDFGVKIKLNPVGDMLRGKRVVVIDDSIVRGTTTKKIVRMLKESGVKEVHVRISAPPTCWPCFYGINTPTREELIAANMTVEEIKDFIGADSLGFLSKDGLYWFDKNSADEWFCDACFTGDYPEELDDAPEIFEMAKTRVR